MPDYLEQESTRAEVDRLPGPVLLEFGAGWCGHCQALAPLWSCVLGRLDASPGCIDAKLATHEQANKQILGDPPPPTRRHLQRAQVA